MFNILKDLGRTIYNNFGLFLLWIFGTLFLSLFIHKNIIESLLVSSFIVGMVLVVFFYKSNDDRKGMRL